MDDLLRSIAEGFNTRSDALVRDRDAGTANRLDFAVATILIDAFSDSDVPTERAEVAEDVLRLVRARLQILRN